MVTLSAYPAGQLGAASKVSNDSTEVRESAGTTADTRIPLPDALSTLRDIAVAAGPDAPHGFAVLTDDDQWLVATAIETGGYCTSVIYLCRQSHEDTWHDEIEVRVPVVLVDAGWTPAMDASIVHLPVAGWRTVLAALAGS